MVAENEQSLQKRPELVPDQLMRGGLIVGIEKGIQGSLMSVTGVALERITRERTEVPPQFKLPERPVYFLDPNTRRLICISNRENTKPFKSGLFAEIVELDDKGEPSYMLSTSEIILPDGNYQAVAIALNSFGLPPSHIPVIEEEKDDEPKKQEFVPWNLYLGQLQDWMNKVTINSGEDFQSFVDRFRSLRNENQIKVQETVKKAFRGGEQGFDENTMPINLIITDKGEDSYLHQASLEAGFYPALLTPKDWVRRPKSREGWFKFDFNGKSVSVLENILRREAVGVAIITRDMEAVGNLFDSLPVMDTKSRAEVHREIFGGINSFQIESPVFAIIDVDLMFTDKHPADEGVRMVEKGMNGLYASHPKKEFYGGLLNKLKADLMLTMFLRGGAPLIK